jgi:hypothetical protein
MSKLFGPVVQQGYVVPDIDEAMAHWIARGVGPFFVERHIRPPGEFDGADVQPDLSAAFAYSGDQQIEVIQQHDDAATIYSEYLAGHPEGGLQHLAMWVDDIDVKLEELGAAYVVRQRYGPAHAYLDSAERPGVMIQLMARSDLMVGLFEGIFAAHEAWDGVQAPVREIDWSTGKPVLPDV